jgi:hypothetical protein
MDGRKWSKSEICVWVQLEQMAFMAVIIIIMRKMESVWEILNLLRIKKAQLMENMNWKMSQNEGGFK